MITLADATIAVATVFVTAWGFSVATSIGAAVVGATLIVGAVASILVFTVLHVASIAGVHGFHEVTILVETGDVDTRHLQLVLDVHARREDHTARGDQLGTYFLYVLHTVGAYAEAHRTESRDGYRVTFGSPCLDHFTDSIPCCIERTLLNTTAQGGFLDYLGLSQGVVQLGLHHEAISAHILSDFLQGLSCDYFNCHSFF